jgi:hypothetical protein
LIERSAELNHRIGVAANEAPRGEKSVESQCDADYWRKRADEAHSVAQAMADPAARRQMHFIAQAYERLADHAERTARRKRGT